MKGKMDKIVFIIIVIILGAFLLRVPILFTRYFDPDEFQHLHAAFSIYHGMVPYRDFFEHHTPLIWLLILPFYYIFGPSISLIFAVRIMMMVFTGGILYLTYLSGKRFHNAQVGLLAVLMLSLFSTPFKILLKDPVFMRLPGCMRSLPRIRGSR